MVLWCNHRGVGWKQNFTPTDATKNIRLKQCWEKCGQFRELTKGCGGNQTGATEGIPGGRVFKSHQRALGAGAAWKSRDEKSSSPARHVQCSSKEGTQWLLLLSAPAFCSPFTSSWVEPNGKTADKRPKMTRAVEECTEQKTYESCFKKIREIHIMKKLCMHFNLLVPK